MRFSASGFFNNHHHLGHYNTQVYVYKCIYIRICEIFDYEIANILSMTPMTKGGRCQWHRWPVISSVNDTVQANMTTLTTNFHSRINLGEVETKLIMALHCSTVLYMYTLYFLQKIILLWCLFTSASQVLCEPRRPFWRSDIAEHSVKLHNFCRRGCTADRGKYRKKEGF
jgi:hypothetical protein